MINCALNVMSVRSLEGAILGGAGLGIPSRGQKLGVPAEAGDWVAAGEQWSGCTRTAGV